MRLAAMGVRDRGRSPKPPTESGVVRMRPVTVTCCAAGSGLDDCAAAAAASSDNEETKKCFAIVDSMSMAGRRTLRAGLRVGAPGRSASLREDDLNQVRRDSLSQAFVLKARHP